MFLALIPDDATIRAAAASTGVAVIGLIRGTPWIQLAIMLRGVLSAEQAEDAARESHGGVPSGDLFSMANAVAALLNAPVTIASTESAPLTDYARTFAERTSRAAHALRGQDRNREAGNLYQQVAQLFQQCDVLLYPTVGITGLTAGDSHLGALPVVNSSNCSP